MNKIAFIGLGNMGSGMAKNQAKAGHKVYAFDLSESARQNAQEHGCIAVSSAREAVAEADIIFTMLPAGQHVVSVYQDDILPHAPQQALLVDCSTIDIESSKQVSALCQNANFCSADAPVSGGTAAAEAGNLTFMVGCREEDFDSIQTALRPMSKASFHAGSFGAGQAAKICNNMLLAITMVGTCEAFAMAEKLGLDAQKFYDISSQASGQSWSMTSYCPVAGPVPNAPSNNDYKPGFAGAMLLKDLTIALQAAQETDAKIPLGKHVFQLYQEFCQNNGDIQDFSAIIKMMK